MLKWWVLVGMDPADHRNRRIIGKTSNSQRFGALGGEANLLRGMLRLGPRQKQLLPNRPTGPGLLVTAC